MAVLTAALLITGCSERENNIAVPESYDTSSLVFTIGHEFSRQLGFIMFAEYQDDPKMYGKVYVPAGYQGPNLGTPYPTLYLLSPYGETEDFYYNHGLKDVADRLISEGVIKPMIIVCMSGSNSYGGSFYGSKDAGGDFTDIIGEIQGISDTGSLIDYVDAVFNTYSDNRHGAGVGRNNRAISGVGVGGYGAMRIAIMHDENFSSVSAVSAPLDFDGATGTGGFVPLFKNIIANLDTTGIGLDSAYRAMDTSFTFPVRSMIFSAAASFTPTDTEYVNPYYQPFNPLSTDPWGWLAADTMKIGDSATYFQPQGPENPHKFHLPFDQNGDVYNPIWSLWLNENPESLLVNNSGALDNTDIMLLTSADGVDPQFQFEQQTLDFETYLKAQGISVDDSTFSGYDGYQATGDRFMYDLFEVILKFHSDNFVLPQ